MVKVVLEWWVPFCFERVRIYYKEHKKSRFLL